MTDQSYPLTNFSWHKNSKTLSAEASDLQLKDWPTYLQIESHHTNTIQSFMKSNSDVSIDGELQAVNYRPLGDTKVVRVTIFND